MKWSHEKVYRKYTENQSNLFSNSIHELMKFIETTFMNEPDLSDIASDREVELAVEHDLLNTFVLYRVFALRCWVEDELSFLVALLSTYNNPDNNYAIVNRGYSLSDELYRFEKDSSAFDNQQDCYYGLMNPWLSPEEIELIRRDVVELIISLDKVDSTDSYLSALGRFYKEDANVMINDHTYKIYYSIEYDDNKLSLAEETYLGHEYIIVNGEPIPYYRNTLQTEAVFSAQWYFPTEANCMTIFYDYILSVAKYNNQCIYGKDDNEEDEGIYLINAVSTYLSQLQHE